jgi:hypothetical protein
LRRAAVIVPRAASNSSNQHVYCQLYTRQCMLCTGLSQHYVAFVLHAGWSASCWACWDLGQPSLGEGAHQSKPMTAAGAALAPATAATSARSTLPTAVPLSLYKLNHQAASIQLLLAAVPRLSAAAQPGGTSIVSSTQRLLTPTTVMATAHCCWQHL